MKMLTVVAMLAMTGCSVLDMFSGQPKSVAEGVKSSVRSNWKSLVRESEKVTGFRDEMKNLPDSTWIPFASDKKSRADATAARETALASSRNADFTAEQQKIFVHNADVNAATVRAAEAYLKVLDAHEKVIEGKLATAEKVRKVVANSYDTVTLAGDFLSIAKSNEEAFNSLLQLDLPPIEMFNDATVQQEFLAITRKLKE